MARGEATVVWSSIAMVSIALMVNGSPTECCFEELQDIPPRPLDLGAVGSLAARFEKPVARAGIDLVLERLAEGLEPRGHVGKGGIDAGVVLSVDAEQRGPDPGEAVGFGWRPVADHGRAQSGIVGCVAEALAAAPTEAYDADVALPDRG